MPQLRLHFYDSVEYRTCARDPSDAITARLREMSDTFLQSYEAKDEENRCLTRGWKPEQALYITMSHVCLSCDEFMS